MDVANLKDVVSVVNDLIDRVNLIEEKAKERAERMQEMKDRIEEHNELILTMARVLDVHNGALDEMAKLASEIIEEMQPENVETVN
jgi:methyl-accepting chemotaxis protein